MRIEDILSRLDKVTKAGRGWKACCPAHDDKDPSLAIDEGSEGRILMKCWAGCDINSIATAMGLKVSDLMGDRIAHHLSPIYKDPRKSSAAQLDETKLEIVRQMRARGEKVPADYLEEERRAWIRSQRRAR